MWSQKERDLPARGPRRVAEHRDRVGTRLGVRPGVHGEEGRFGNRVVAEKDDDPAPGLADAAVARGGGSRVLLREEAERIGRPIAGQALRRVVPGPVVDHDDLEVGGVALPREGVEDGEERAGPPVGRDDDRERHAPRSKMSASVVRTSAGALSKNGAKKAEVSRSSPGYVGTSRIGKREKISASERFRPAWTARRFSARAAWWRWIQASARSWAIVSGSSTRDPGARVVADPEEAPDEGRSGRRAAGRVRIALELGRARIARQQHLGDARDERHDHRGHQVAEERRVQVLVDRRERVLLEEVAAREHAERLPRRAAAVTGDRPGLGDDPPAEDPLPPAEVHVLQVGEVVVVEASGGEELVAPDRHEPAAGEQAVLARPGLGEPRDGTAHLGREGVAVEGQEPVGEVVARARAVGETSARRDDVGVGAGERVDEPPRGVRLDDRVVVDEEHGRRRRGLDAEPAAGREADVASRSAIRRTDGCRARTASNGVSDALSTSRTSAERPCCSGGVERGERLEQVLGAAVVHDDDRCFRSGHGARKITGRGVSSGPARREARPGPDPRAPGAARPRAEPPRPSRSGTAAKARAAAAARSRAGGSREPGRDRARRGRPGAARTRARRRQAASSRASVPPPTVTDGTPPQAASSSRVR